MSDDALEKILAARDKARRARQRLDDNLARLRSRARPAAIVGDMVSDMIDETTAQVKRRPLVALAGVAALGMSLAVPGLRQLVGAAGSVAWRNREAIGRFIASRSAARR